MFFVAYMQYGSGFIKKLGYRLMLSAVIITLNEERNIGRCIDALQHVVEEIIVVDACSKDNTKEICQSKGVRFVQREWEDYSATKNFANSLASYPYILSIDADEVVSPELATSIRQAKHEGLRGCYSLNRFTNYCGHWIRHSGWYPNEKVRLFPKSQVKWVGEFVHEKLDLEGLPVHKLKGDLYHYSYHRAQDHRARADRYSILTAKKLHAQGKKSGPIKPYASAVGRFISMYVLKLGLLDGVAGFRIAHISALSNIVKYKELRRLSKQGHANV